VTGAVVLAAPSEDLGVTDADLGVIDAGFSIGLPIGQSAAMQEVLGD
jgi:hypothetical protein